MQFHEKKLLLRFISTFLLLTLLLSGCDKNTNHSDKENPLVNSVDRTSQEAIDEQNRFESFTDSIFKTEIVKNSINLHYTVSNPQAMGIDSSNITLGDISKSTYQESIDTMKQYLNELNEFNYDLLTDNQQLTYDIMIMDLEDAIDYDDDFYYYDDYMSPLKGMQQTLPTLLAEYSFSDEQDIINYLSLLKLFPTYFNQLIAFEKEKSEQGLFMPSFEVDQVIDQCNQFISNVDHHFMIETFNERVEALSSLAEEKKATYIQQNTDAFKNFVIPSYQNLIEEITKLKGTGKEKGGLCNYEKGKEYYESLVRDYTGSSKSIKEIKDMIEKRFGTDTLQLATILASDPDLISKVYEYPMDVSDPQTVLSDLESKISEDFPTGPVTNCTIKQVPSSMENYASPAYYLIPPIDNYTDNTIYINNSSSNGSTDLFSTLAHEGFPGHLYQNTFYRSTNPSKIRNLFNFGGYDEGWATYVEIYSYSISGKSEQCYKINQLEISYSFAIYCLADIGIHYEGWTLDDTIDFCKKQGFDQDTATKIYQTLLEDPALYLEYYVGYLEINNLLNTAKDELGEQFSLKEFHTFLLTTGPAQFDVINKWMNQWIASQKNK